jgi:transposase
MAYDYMRGDREQLFLLPPSMLDWLKEGHLAYFMIDAVGLLDTSALHEVHPNDGPGRSVDDPEMMLTALLFAYATGMRSSRAIEAACRQDLAFRVICVNLVPHFTTIARFRAENEEGITAVFVEVRKLCRRAGLASLGVIAIDGTKIGSAAALDTNLDVAWVRTEMDKILAEAAQTDTEEDTRAKRSCTLVDEPLRRWGTASLA